MGRLARRQLNQTGLRMRRLIHYSLGVAAAAGAEYLLFYVMYVYVLSCASLACVAFDLVPAPSGWDLLFGNYFIGMWGAVGGLLGLVVAARLAPRHSWGLSLAQGIIVMLAPFAVRNLSYLLVIDIAVWASAGAIGALLALGLYIAGSVVVGRGTAIYR
jgi:hypothetical protein